MSLLQKKMVLFNKGGSGPVAELNDMPASRLSNVLSGGSLPLCAYRMHSNGQGQTSTGSTAAALIYTQFGDDWLISGLNSEFECEYIQTATSGAAGTLFGVLAAFGTLTSSRGITWQKDTNSVGTAIWQGTVEIREIAVPANTTGALVIQMTSQVAF